MAKKKAKSKYVLPDGKLTNINGIDVTVYGNEQLSQMNIADAAKDYTSLFAVNKNLARAIPTLQDGLKPVLRRLLWAWWLSSGKPTNTNPETLKRLKFSKGQIITSNAMQYHPHSDSGSEGVLGRLGQTFTNNAMLLETQGSFGNLISAEAASGRYIEARLSEFAIDCFFDGFNDYCVLMKPRYDGDGLEPEYLPAKYPYILFNPQFSGIGTGAYSGIPPYNIGEVLEATIKLIKNPKEKIMLIPDMPNEVDIVDTGDFAIINKTGGANDEKVKVTMRAAAEIDYKENSIHFTSIPMQIKTKPLIMKLLEIKKEQGIFDEIVQISDATQGGNVDLTIYLKKTANPEKVLKKLYKKTDFQTSLPVRITVVDDYKSYTYGLKDLLLEWIDYRRDAVRAMFLNKYQSLVEKQHMNKVLIMVFSKENIADAVKIAKNSSSKKETVDKFMKRFKITSLQAQVIADMHVYQFNKDSYERFLEEKKKLKEEVNRIDKILNDDKKIDEFIIEQLSEGIKKYAVPRKSKVIKDNDDDSNIPDIDYLFAIDTNGIAKKISVKSKSIGSVGDNHCALNVLQINNRESVIVLDEYGYITKVPISSIPEMNPEDNGLELCKFFKVKGEISAMMELPSMEMLKKADDLSILIITRKGYGKITPMSDFKRLTGTKTAIALDSDDRVAGAIFIKGNSTKDIIIYTNYGNGIRLDLKEFRSYGAAAKGLRMLTFINKDEEVVNVCGISSSKGNIVYITNEGKAKITELKYFPVMKRTDAILPMIKLGEKERLIGLNTVGKDDIITIYKQKSEEENIKVSDIPVKARIAKGEKVVKCGKGDKVVAFKCFKN